MLSATGVKPKAWGQNQHSNESNTFWSFNCKSFTSFPTDKDLPYGQSCYAKVTQ